MKYNYIIIMIRVREVGRYIMLFDSDIFFYTISATPSDTFKTQMPIVFLTFVITTSGS